MTNTLSYGSAANDDDYEALPCSDLLEVEFRAKALAYLFENLGTLDVLPLPEDLRDVHTGIGKLIWDLSTEICTIRQNLEAQAIHLTQLELKSKGPTQSKRNSKSKRKRY